MKSDIEAILENVNEEKAVGSRQIFEKRFETSFDQYDDNRCFLLKIRR